MYANIHHFHSDSSLRRRAIRPTIAMEYPIHAIARLTPLGIPFTHEGKLFLKHLLSCSHGVP